MQETEVRDWRYQLRAEDRVSSKNNILTKPGPVRGKPERTHKKVDVKQCDARFHMLQPEEPAN